MRFTSLSAKRFIFYISYFTFYSLLSSCSENNVTVDDALKKFFDDNHVTGTFALYDNGQGRFTVYNLSRYKDSPYLPASTFKIVNSLIGIQTGVCVEGKFQKSKCIGNAKKSIGGDTIHFFGCTYYLHHCSCTTGEVCAKQE